LDRYDFIHSQRTCFIRSEVEGFPDKVTLVQYLEQFKTSFASRVPLGRVGSLDEVAKDASFLASGDRTFFDENFAAAIALLDEPHPVVTKSSLNDITWWSEPNGIKASTAPKPYGVS
jgi:hypothetical protein